MTVEEGRWIGVSGLGGSLGLKAGFGDDSTLRRGHIGAVANGSGYSGERLRAES